MSKQYFIAHVPTPAKEWASPRRSDAKETVQEAIRQVFERYPKARKVTISRAVASGVENSLNYIPGASREYTKKEALAL